MSVVIIETLHVPFEECWNEIRGALVPNQQYMIRTYRPQVWEMVLRLPDNITYEYKNISICGGEMEISQVDDDDEMKIPLRDDELRYFPIIKFKGTDVEIDQPERRIYYKQYPPDWIWDYITIPNKNEYMITCLDWHFGDPIPNNLGYRYSLHILNQRSEEYWSRIDCTCLGETTLMLYGLNWEKNRELVQQWMLYFLKGNTIVLPQDSKYSSIVSPDNPWIKFVQECKQSFKLVAGNVPRYLESQDFYLLWGKEPPLSYPFSSYKGVFVNPFYMNYKEGEETLVVWTSILSEDINRIEFPNVALVDGEEKPFKQIMVKTTPTKLNLEWFRHNLQTLDFVLQFRDSIKNINIVPSHFNLQFELNKQRARNRGRQDVSISTSPHLSKIRRLLGT